MAGAKGFAWARLLASDEVILLDLPAPRDGVVPRLTVVTPVFNEERNLDRYFETVSELLLERRDFKASVVFVDDGSQDGSWPKIQALVRRSDRFSGIRLSRNFGAHVALAAGLDAVPPDTDLVATLACDLQDPPSTIVDFVAAWREGASIVWGARRTREESEMRQRVSKLLETLLRRYALPRNSKFVTGSFLLMDRTVLDCFRQLREHNRVTFALVAWTGFDQSVVYYDRKARTDGRTGWTFGKMINALYDVFIGFSPAPAKFLSVIGFSMFGLSLALVTYLLLNRLLNQVQVGWTGLMATMSLLFGLLFMMLGLMSEYLHRIFVEVKGRPLYFVSATAGARAVAREDRGDV